MTPLSPVRIPPQHLRSFISEHLDEIIHEWESFAREVSPASAGMTSVALRDHVKQMLQAIVLDIDTSQSDREQYLKSKGLARVMSVTEKSAESHGVLRHSDGFDLNALVAEFRALRATVLRIWIRTNRHTDDGSAYEIARFNEAIDQVLNESVAAYSDEMTRSRDTFLAILGHDLRSPLGAVGGALSVLSLPVEGAARAKALAVGKRSVASMAAMIRDLLEYTRTRLGVGIPVVAVDGDLEKVCRAVIGEVSLVYPETEFRFESSGDLEGRLDADRMQQAVGNLLNNAVQHGTPGAAIFVIATGGRADLVVEVKNEGVIPADHLAGIFDPLVQAPTERAGTLPATNLGLGLFIARAILVAHGGTLDVRSATGEGTTFTAKLPRTVARARAPVAKRSEVPA